MKRWLLLLALVACSKSRRDHAAAAPSADRPAEIVARHLKLLDPGTAPLQEVRLAAVTGKATSYRITGASSLERGVVGRPSTHTEISLGMSFRQVVLGAAADGSFRVELTLTGLSLPADYPAAGRALFESLQGLRVTLELDAHGVVQRGTVHTPAGATAEALEEVPDMAADMQTMVPLLPDRPVGLGARWVVEQQLRVGGVDRHEIYDCRLDGRSEAVVDLGCTTELSAEPQDFRLPGMKPGDRARLASYQGSGEQSLHLTLGGPAVVGHVVVEFQRSFDLTRGRTVRIDDSRKSTMDQTIQ